MFREMKSIIQGLGQGIQWSKRGSPLSNAEVEAGNVQREVVYYPKQGVSNSRDKQGKVKKENESEQGN